MSEAGEPRPRQFRILAPFVQCRVKNPYPVGQLRGPWVSRGGKQGSLLAEEDVHPDDLRHLLQAMTPGPFSTPYLEEIPAPAEEGTSR